MTLLELLENEKVEEFNAQRGKRSAPDLFAVDLAGRNLRGVDLSGANLEKADLTDADLTDAILVKARLDGADMTGARLDGVVALRSKWREAYLDKSSIDGADFSGADFTEAVLTECFGADVSFRNCKLRAADLSKANLEDADFSEARLDKADFSGANLPRALMSAVSMAAASFDRANLAQADMSGARASGASFERTVLKEVKLGRADLTAANLEGADLDGAVLVEADLAEASLKGVSFKGVDLRRARLDDSMRQGDALEGALLDAGATEPDDKPPRIHLEEIRGCVGGDTVALLWENEDSDGVLVNRAAFVGAAGFDGRAPAVPGAVEIALSKDIVPWGDDFGVLVAVERPSGTELLVSRWNAAGEKVASQSLPLGYQPAVRPVIVGGDEVRIYGLGRRGPTLFCHKLTDEGLELVWGKAAKTAIGLLGSHEPVLITRGGVVSRIEPTGLGDPMSEPKGFSPRVAASCNVDERTVLAWAGQDGLGLKWSSLQPGASSEVLGILAKEAVTGVDICALEDEAVVIFAREEGEGLGAVGVWALHVDRPGAKPVPVLVDPMHDIHELRIISVQGGAITVLCTTLAEEVLVVRLAGDDTSLLCQLP